jgi:hypothetical protein
MAGSGDGSRPIKQSNHMNRPSKMLYGVTHDATGEPRIIEPKTVKVGIGLAKGKAVHAYIDLEGKWVVFSGYGQNIIRERFDTKAKAQMRYRELKKDAPDRKYPEKLPYFTFLHVAANGDFEPDWDAIEAHGPIPTEIDVIFIHEEPFAASYQFWTATERKCEGDGKVALRSLSLAITDAEKALAAAAERQGEKQFPVSLCWLAGCQYSKPSGDRPAQCRPMGRLLFQLLISPRLGGTAVFNTAGYRSISQIFSSIEILKSTTRGFVTGIPLKMVLSPYRIAHAGKLVTQYAVRLEFRAKSALELKQSLADHAFQYQIAGSEPLKLLEGISIREVVTPIQDPEEIPAALIAEFEHEPAAEEQLVPPDPELIDEAELGPAGALENAWEEPERPAEPVFPKWPLASSEDLKKFYDLCRSRGMTDEIIINKAGTFGFEKIEEITQQFLPGLMLWAESYKIQQGSLI